MVLRRRFAPLVFALPFTSACTLLVKFIDAPDGGDASFDAPYDDVSRDAAEEDTSAEGYDASKVCKGLGDGFYCGYNGLNGQPPADWLVDCVDGSAIVRVCDAGCLAFPSGSPDCCNECPGEPNGMYCGSQFPTYPSFNAAYLMSCGQGIAAIQTKCTNGCQPGPGDASCK
jgi:hypothetical protein